LDDATNLPGQYRMTFADGAVTLQVGTIAWVKSQATPSELTAALTPLPSDATPATPRNTPVDTVQVVFRDNAGNPLFVTGVNTTVTGPAINNAGAGQFGLFRNGAEINFPVGATVSGSGSTYFINGLSGVTDQAGGYVLVVRDLAGITTTGGGASLIAPYGAAWEYQDPTTVQQVVRVGGNPANPTFFRQGDSLVFQATFSNIVRVGVGGAALPTLPLNIGGQVKSATYQGGAGTNTLTFSYPIAAADVDIDGIEVISTLGGGAVTNDYGDSVIPTFTAPVLPNVRVDGQGPTVLAAAPPAPGNYNATAGTNNLDITLTFNEPVTVTTSGGTPTIPLTISGAVRQASYVNVNGSAVTFQLAADTVTLANHGLANGAVVSFSSITTTTGINLNTNYYVINATANTFQLATSVTGARIDLTNADGTGTIVQVSNISNTLVFRYVITSATDVFANGSFTVSSTVSLNGGTMKDAAGNDYALAVPAVTVTGVNINRTAPNVIVTSGLPTAPAITKTSKISDVIELTATFAQAVTVTNTPTIGITVGGTPQVARYVSGT
jgi:hypothetical protein